MLPDDSVQASRGGMALHTDRAHPGGTDVDTVMEVTQTSSSKRLSFPRDETWSQRTIIEEEAGRAQWEGYRFKVSDDFQWELSNPEMGYRESCGLLFRRNAEVTTDKLHHVPTSLEACVWDREPLALHPHSSLIWIPQHALQNYFATGCCLLNHRSEICYLWEIIKGLSFSRLPLIKWVLLLSF